jgi:hypothetical protein
MIVGRSLKHSGGCGAPPASPSEPAARTTKSGREGGNARLATKRAEVSLWTKAGLFTEWHLTRV